MRSYRSRLQDYYNLRHLGIEAGTDIKSKKQIFLSPKLLPKGIHVLGPPGSGKTKLLLHLFTLFCRMPKTAVIIFNPKGGFAKAARNVAINAGQASRLIIFDPADSEFICGYNPLKPNNLPIGVHTKMVREGVRASWGQSSFDATPQLARFLFLALYVARELEMTFAEAAQILRPQSPLRYKVLPLIRNPYIKETFEYFDSLRPERQDDLIAPCLARLEAWTLDPMLRAMLTQRERALNIAEVIAGNKMLIVDVPFYNPLRPDDAKLLLRMLLNDVLASVFGRDEKTNRVVIMCDEVHTYANEDLCTAVELGRELNLCAILAHQHLGQLTADDGSTKLLDAIKNCCKTRVVFGGNWKKDLEDLTEDMMIDQYNPWAIKDEITALELDPIETTRNSYATSESTTRGTSKTRGTGKSTSEGQSEGNTQSKTQGTGKSEGESEGESEVITDGESEEQSEGESLQIGQSKTAGSAAAITNTRARTRGTGQAVATGRIIGTSSGRTQISGGGETISPEGDILAGTISSASGLTSGDFQAESMNVVESETENETQSRAISKSRSRAQTDSVSNGKNTGRSRGTNKSRSQGVNRGRNRNHSTNTTQGVALTTMRALETGTSESQSTGTNQSNSQTRGVTEAPFYEYRKRRVVTSRTFLTQEEQMTEFLKMIKEQPVGHFLLKVQGKKARFMRAPFVPDPQLPIKRLEAAREKIFSHPYYTKKSDPQMADHAQLSAPLLVDPSTTVRIKETTQDERGSKPNFPRVDLSKAIKGGAKKTAG